MKILWVKSGGLVPMDAGGKIRSFNIARELAKRHDVTMFTFYPRMTPDPHEELRDTFARVELVPLSFSERGSIGDTLAYAANALTSRPYQIRKYCRIEAARRLTKLVGENGYDALLCDYLLTAGVIPWNTGVPKVIFTHNVEAMIWQRHRTLNTNRLWRLAAWRESRTIARAERRYTEMADHVLTVSDEDRKFFTEFLPGNKVTTVPTGVDLEYFQPAPSPKNNALVFTGSMDWIPNEDAVVYFCDEILPLIRQRIPDVTVWIVGKKPTKRVLALKEEDARLFVTGTVEDIRPYVRDAAVYIVPLRIGGGTRIKIFEAMALGKPVVSTRIGAEGLPVEDGKNILLADTPEEFAARTVALLSEPEAAERMGRQARTLVEGRYGWPAVTNVVDQVLQRIARN